jgi:hypothetical protein
MGARPGPRHRLNPDNATLRAPEQPQLALDNAPCRAGIQMAPALEAAVVNHELAPGLPAPRAHAPVRKALTKMSPDDRDGRSPGSLSVAQRRRVASEARLSVPRPPQTPVSGSARSPRCGAYPPDAQEGSASRSRPRSSPGTLVSRSWVACDSIRQWLWRGAVDRIYGVSPQNLSAPGAGSAPIPRALVRPIRNTVWRAPLSRRGPVAAMRPVTRMVRPRAITV